MTRIIDLVSDERIQYIILLGVSLGAALLISIQYYRNRLIFQTYFGKINAFIVILVVILLAFLLFTFLLSKGWFAIYTPGNLNGLLVASGLGAILALVMILVDLKVVFPPDMNLLYPESLVFYPAIGYVVEILFHVLPVTICLLFLSSLSKNLDFENVILPCLIVVSILEPVYQTVAGFSRSYPVWVSGVVAAHIFVINIFQLLIFKRYDFISMLTLRLVYYLLWHIVWGYARLRLLF